MLKHPRRLFCWLAGALFGGYLKICTNIASRFCRHQKKTPDCDTQFLFFSPWKLLS